MTRPPSTRLRVLFAVQGEGRGHLTQALALADALRAWGHEVPHVLVGASERRRVPAFFTEAIGAPVTPYASPNFVSDARGRISLTRTAVQNLAHARRFTPSLDTLSRVIDEAEPDVVVNFYDGMMGLFALLRWPGIPLVAVGHQFMFGHPAYPFAGGQPVQKAAAKAYTRLTGAGASARLALSFYDAAPHPGLHVTPPLLRRSLRRLDGSGHDGSLLVYLMEPKMAQDLRAWSARRPDVPVHCFSDVPPGRDGSLTFHALSGTRFLEHMARARRRLHGRVRVGLGGLVAGQARPHGARPGPLRAAVQRPGCRGGRRRPGLGHARSGRVHGLPRRAHA